MAGLFGLLWALRGRGVCLSGDLWLVANVCEEGLGNLRGIKAVVDRFGSRPLAYIVVEGMALGQIYQRGLGVQRYRLSVRTAAQLRRTTDCTDCTDPGQTAPPSVVLTQVPRG